MGHYRNPTACEEGDGLGQLFAAFKLDALGTGFAQQSRTSEEGLLGRGLITAERQVDDHAGALRPAHHRLAVGNHHFQGDPEGAGHAIQDHADRVTDNDHIGLGIHPARHRHAVRSQNYQIASAFALLDCGHAQTVFTHMAAHRSLLGVVQLSRAQATIGLCRLT
ncbi:hypothetical protein D3C76_654290 [compost metagenome]